MTDTRDSISKLIEQLRQSDALLDQLKPSALESVVAELAAQNKTLVEFTRGGQAADILVKMQDELGAFRSFAFEVKHLSPRRMR